MTAYKCDVCGAYYTKVRRIVINTTSAMIGDHGILCDICPGCIDAIQKVINERKGLNK